MIFLNVAVVTKLMQLFKYSKSSYYFISTLVDEGAAHIHNAGNKKQEGTKLRKLMTYAWPCLLSKNCVDPATRYHGHLLLSHIIAKFAIHKRIVLQVFHSLLKAHAVEARNVVRQALEILTPSMPGRVCFKGKF